MDPRDWAEVEFLERVCSRTLPNASDCCSRTYRSLTLYIRIRESVVQRLTHLGDQFATTRPSATRDGLRTELRRLRRILAHVRGKCEMAQELHDGCTPACRACMRESEPFQRENPEPGEDFAELFKTARHQGTQTELQLVGRQCPLGEPLFHPISCTVISPRPRPRNNVPPSESLDEYHRTSVFLPQYNWCRSLPAMNL